MVILAGARKEIEVEIADIAARRRIGDGPLGDVGIPYDGMLALGERHAQEFRIDVEHRTLDVVDRKILGDRVLVYGILRFVEHIVVVADVPRVDRRGRYPEVFRFERGEGVEIGLRAGQEFRIEGGEKRVDSARRLRHLVGEHVGGPVRIPVHVRQPVAHADRRLENRHVLRSAIAIGEVIGFARRTVRGIVHELRRRAFVDGNVVTVGRFLESGYEVVGQPDRLCRRDMDRRRVVRDVRIELRLERVDPIAQRDRFFTLCGRETRARALERHEPKRREFAIVA